MFSGFTSRCKHWKKRLEDQHQRTRAVSDLSLRYVGDKSWWRWSFARLFVWLGSRALLLCTFRECLTQWVHRIQTRDEASSSVWTPQSTLWDSRASVAAIQIGWWEEMKIWFLVWWDELTLSILISLSAIFLISGSSSVSTYFLIATNCPVSRFLHLNTRPYEPSPIFDIFSYFSILFGNFWFFLHLIVSLSSTFLWPIKKRTDYSEKS